MQLSPEVQLSPELDMSEEDEQLDEIPGKHVSNQPPNVSTRVDGSTSAGPIVQTKLGRIRGIWEDGTYIFKSIPYSVPVGRFERTTEPRPWTKTRDATKWGRACIGAKTDHPEYEKEGCERMTIWVPKTEQTNLPVIVYIHGGQNQYGYGQDPHRQGDMIVKSWAHPVIFVSVDYRLGIFGWIQGHNAIPNLGLHDQQMALRWVRNHIGAFGGNPKKVTLQGESEGSHNIVAHLVSPGSHGLFHRAILHSPPADLWSRKTNKVRTNYVITESGCAGTSDPVACLKSVDAKKLQGKDWKGADLNKKFGTKKWFKALESLQEIEREQAVDEDSPSYLGWHPVVDGYTVPREPRILIRKGAWNKVPVLITVSKNESMGIIPAEDPKLIEKSITALFKEGDFPRVEEEYTASLLKDHIRPKNRLSLMHQIATDKMWTCDARSLAYDIVRGGGKAHVVMLWHSPKHDAAGNQVNEQCSTGATCHSAEMMYAIPQGRGKGIPDTLAFKKEAAFGAHYMEDLLRYVYAQDHIWAPYSLENEPMTFYDANGPRYINHYRKPQCDILDVSVGEQLPAFLQKRAEKLAAKVALYEE